MQPGHPPPGPNPLAVKLPVGVPEPAEGRLVVAGQAVVQVEQRVVTLHILVQCVLQVPSEEQSCSGLPCTPGGPSKFLLISHPLPTEPCPAWSILAAECRHVVRGGGAGLGGGVIIITALVLSTDSKSEDQAHTWSPHVPAGK